MSREQTSDSQYFRSKTPHGMNTTYRNGICRFFVRRRLMANILRCKCDVRGRQTVNIPNIFISGGTLSPISVRA